MGGFLSPAPAHTAVRASWLLGTYIFLGFGGSHYFRTAKKKKKRAKEKKRVSLTATCRGVALSNNLTLVRNLWFTSVADLVDCTE